MELLAEKLAFDLCAVLEKQIRYFRFLSFFFPPMETCGKCATPSESIQTKAYLSTETSGHSCTRSSVPHPPACRPPLLPSSLFLTSLTCSSFSALPVFLSPAPKESSLTSPRVLSSTRPCTVGQRVLGRCSRQSYLLSSAFNLSALSPPGRFHPGLGFEQMQAGVEPWSALSCVCWPALDLLTHRSGSAALRKLRSWYQREAYECLPPVQKLIWPMLQSCVNVRTVLMVGMGGYLGKTCLTSCLFLDTMAADSS